MGIESQYVWMDGALVPYEKATIPFFSATAHYGIGVFEGIRSYSTQRGPAVFRLAEHVRRLFDSARVLGMRDLPFSEEEICAAAKQTVAVNGFNECYIRPLVFLGGETLSLNIEAASLHVGIAAWAWGAYLGEAAREMGVRANVSSYTRNHLNATMTKAKITGNYPNSILAKTESTRLGFDEAIMMDAQGYVSECTGENLFIVRGGKIFTPPMAPVLEGITRDSLVHIGRHLGLEITEALISRDQLYIADEVFMCGTAADVVAIREIDFRTIGSGKMGPVTRQIQEGYFQAVHGAHPLSEGWLDYVEDPHTVSVN